MKNIINVKPECISKLDSSMSQRILDELFNIYKQGIKAVEVLDSIDFNENPDEIADYGLLFDLEDILIEKDINFDKFGQVDPTGIVKYARNAFTYWNEVCELLDIDSCSNTIMDCAEMQTKLKFAISNSTTFIYNILQEFIKYIVYLQSKQMPEISKATIEQNPEYSEVELNFAPAVLEVLRKEGEPEQPETMIPFVSSLLGIVNAYPSQNTAILKYFSDYSDFYELVDEFQQVDVQQAYDLIMPYDVKYILSASVKDNNAGGLLEEMNSKVGGRLGSVDGTSSLTFYELDTLVWLSECAKSSTDYEKLFVNERYISSDLEKCYLAIARKNLSEIMSDNRIYSGMEDTRLF